MFALLKLDVCITEETFHLEVYPSITDKGTFKYHMALREGVCSNHQCTVMWERGFGQIVSTTFIVAKKACFTVYFVLCMVYVGRGGWLKTSYGVERVG